MGEDWPGLLFSHFFLALWLNHLSLTARPNSAVTGPEDVIQAVAAVHRKTGDSYQERDLASVALLVGAGVSSQWQAGYFSKPR